MSENLFKQCVLVKSVGESKIIDTSWIPQKFAKQGKQLKIKNSHGIWEDGWTVESAGANALEFVALQRQEDSQRYLAHKVAIKDDRNLGKK